MRLALRLALIVAACSVLLSTSRIAMPTAKPPHTVPPVSAVQHVGTQPDWLSAAADVGWVVEQERERERAERERFEAAERMAGSRAAANVAVVGGGDCTRIAAEFGVSVGVVQRESHCTAAADLLNPTGCVERGTAFGCIGPVQLHLGHFRNPSPWGGVGACWGLDPYSYADQIECAHRLGPSAWG